MEARIEEIFSKPLMPERPAAEARPPPPPSPPVRPQETAKPAEPTVKAPEPAPPQTPVAVAEEKEEAVEVFECPQCGAAVPIDSNSCPKCGVLFAEEGAEAFQCPNCNTLVNVDAKSCPGCGALFVEPDEAAAAAAPAPPTPPAKKEAEEVRPPPTPAAPASPQKPKEEPEKKGLFGGLFRKSKKGPEPPSKPEAEVRVPPSPPPAPRKPTEAAPTPTVKEEAVAPPARDKGKELARMVAEMKPLLALARERDVEIGESKQLIDDAAVAGRERRLDNAIELVQRAKSVLMSKMDDHLADEIARLTEEIKVAKGFGGDTARAETYAQEVSRARSAGDVEAACVYIDKVRNELLPITGRYNESRKKLEAMKQLIADAEAFIVDTKEARALVVEASKAMDLKDFDRLDMLLKSAKEKLYKNIPSRMNEEIRKAKDDLLDAKMRNVNITPMITVLKSATSLMKSGEYAQALKEMREFKEMMRNSA